MKTTRATTPTHEEIAARARTIWEQAGQPDGRDTEFWLQAERELNDTIAQAPGIGAAAAKSPGVPAPARAKVSAR
jgi:hypothetical protein